jgi:acyl transferase domain-containing protein
MGLAIVGMAGRFPGAANIDEFWRNLRDGVETISRFTDEELRAAGVEESRLAAPNFVKAKGVLDGADLFDAAFFGFTPREAEIMDPQHRVFMECVWEALEHAGYDPKTCKGAVGLFGGESMNTYLLFNLMSNRELLETVGLMQTSVQNRTDHLTMRAAYELDLKGPALTVQTACSTSLVAVHMACQSLLNYECDLALAGGVSVTAPLKNGYTYMEGGIYSPDGHCRAFDERAQGTVEGNGVGVVAIKRLADALADGDTIHAVIRGSAVNNDGSLKVGYTAPSVEGQAKVILEAQAVSGVGAETISYVETHGTGTALGDPIEIEALTEAFRQGAGAHRFCAIGSVKTNIGHLDAAAGVAGLIKTVLALKRRELPPSLNFGRENPRIDFDASPFYVNAQLSEWKTSGAAPRRAGVSSFGIGGANAHVIVEEAPPATTEATTEREWHLLPLSARTVSALDAATVNLREHLKENPALNVADVAHTLQNGRRAFNHRRVVICRDLPDASRALESLDARRVFTSLREPRERPVVFMFPGQGAQYLRMGEGVYRTERIFRETVDICSEHLAPRLGFDLRGLLYPPNAASDATAAERLNQTAVTQPALFVIEYALARLWMEWGVRPEAMIGHSIGEYVAACLAGVFSLEDALRLVAERGRLMQGLPAGSMLVAPLPEAKARALIERRAGLSLAAVNAPELCVVAGPSDAVDGLEAELSAEGVVCRRLRASHAFHSEMMEPILAPFMEEASKTTLNAPAIPYLSNVTGTWITDREATDPAYWARHIRQTVLFSEDMSELFKVPERVLVEVGPGRTLSVIARHHPLRGAGQMAISSLRHPDETEPDGAYLMATLGRLWLANTQIDWTRLAAGEGRSRVPLPTYPFDRQRYWVEPRAAARRDSPRKNPNLSEWFYAPSWRRTVSAPLKAAELEGGRRRWLLFADKRGLAQALRARLEELGQETLTVEAGAEFRRTGAQSFVVNPRRREDYQSLLKQAGASSDAPPMILHLWNVTSQAENDEDGFAEDSQFLGFYSLLFLAQALGEQSLALAPASAAATLPICVVSNNLQEVTGEESLSPEKATLLGPCRVITQEYQNIKLRSVDVIMPEPGAGLAVLAERIIVEAVTDESSAAVAYRGAYRWMLDFERIKFDANGLDANRTPARLREKGVYLITGGMGGVGLELAQYLATAARARLVLIGRTPLPPRAEWDAWLKTRGEGDEVSRRILKARAIEAAGGEALVVAADVTDEGQLRAALAEAQSRFGPIHGVIHAAGVAGGGVIQLKTPEMAANVLAPKVTGARLLDRLLRDAPLDFFILCSSRSSVLGGFGAVDYSAANAYLDAFAHYRRARDGSFTVAIDWDAWRSVGMLADAAARLGLADNRRAAVAQPADGQADGRATSGGDAAGAHPLLDRKLEDGTAGETYATELSVARHWVLDDHRIVGTAVMPGTAYLEMARAAVEREAPAAGALEIRDAFFLAPLALRDDERREIRINVKRRGDEFEYRVVGRQSADAGDSEWQTFSTGRLGYVADDPPRRHDLVELAERCDLEEIVIEDDDDPDPDLGPRWQSLRRVHLGRKELLATLELPEIFAPDLERLKLHPALLDRATGAAKHHLIKDGYYLPMGYRRLRIKAALPRKVYTYVKFRDEGYSRRETITFDIMLLDEDGYERVVIEGFSQKRVNDATGTIKTLVGVAQRKTEGEAASNGNVAGPASDGGVYQRSLGEGMSPEEGVDAFRRILAGSPVPQVIVSTKDLWASIEQVNSFDQARLAEEAEGARRARPAHPRPDVQTPYVAPRNEVEQKLAAIWQEMLGIEQVSVHDNFFELGGDSVQAIQISARINQAGLQFSPQQLFQHQTIADLAAILAPSLASDGNAAEEMAAAAAVGAGAEGVDSHASSFPLARLSQEELRKIEILIEESDEFNDSDV